MPVNPVLAPTFLKVFYHETAINHTHTQRLYFDGIATDLGASVFRFNGFTDTAHPSGWQVSEIVCEWFNRAFVSNGDLPPYTLEKVEVWAGGSGTPTFLGYDGGDYTSFVGGGHSPIAAAYDMLVFECSGKAQWRVTFMDNGSAAPQRFALSQPPPTDDLGLFWFALKSAVLFSNQDGLRLQLIVSANTGVNDKLARTYGRSVTP